MVFRLNSCCAGFLACLLLTFVSAPADAQTWYELRAELSRLKLQTSLTAATLRAEATAKVSSSALPADKYVSKNLPLPKSSLGAMVKKGLKMFGPIGTAMLVIEAAGYLLDEDGSATGTPGEVYKAYPAGTTLYAFQTSAGTPNCSTLWEPSIASTASACAAAMTSDTPNTYSFIGLNENNSGVFHGVRPDGSIHVVTVSYGTQTAQNEIQEVIADDVLGDEVVQSEHGDEAVNDIFDRAKRFPELAHSYPELSNWLQDLDDEAALAESDPQHDPAFDGAVTEQAPATEVNVDIPTGCKLLPQVCEILDWLTGEPSEPIPDDPAWDVNMITPADLPDTPNELPSSAAACPSDTFTVFGEAIPVPYQPMCDLAVKVRPLLLAASWFFAIFIVIRK